MIRILIAALLLRTTGAKVRYQVRRVYGTTRGSGTAVLKTPSYLAAKTKFKAMRIAKTDTITVSVVAVVRQRRGTVPKPTAPPWQDEAGGSKEDTEEGNGD